MEKRKAKMIVNKSGSGGSVFRVTVPTAWIRKLGLSEEIRSLELEFSNDFIKIKKDE